MHGIATLLCCAGLAHSTYGELASVRSHKHTIDLTESPSGTMVRPQRTMAVSPAGLLSETSVKVDSEEESDASVYYYLVKKSIFNGKNGQGRKASTVEVSVVNDKKRNALLAESEHMEHAAMRTAVNVSTASNRKDGALSADSHNEQGCYACTCGPWGGGRVDWPWSGCHINCGAKCGNTCCCIKGWHLGYCEYYVPPTPTPTPLPTPEPTPWFAATDPCSLFTLIQHERVCGLGNLTGLAAFDGITYDHAPIIPEERGGVCEIKARTNGGTCSDWCSAQGAVCKYAQDNRGGCNIDDRYPRAGRSIENYGCEQSWGDQICGCLPSPPR